MTTSKVKMTEFIKAKLNQTVRQDKTKIKKYRMKVLAIFKRKTITCKSEQKLHVNLFQNN